MECKSLGKRPRESWKRCTTGFDFPAREALGAGWMDGNAECRFRFGDYSEKGLCQCAGGGGKVCARARGNNFRAPARPTKDEILWCYNRVTCNNPHPAISYSPSLRRYVCAPVCLSSLPLPLFFIFGRVFDCLRWRIFFPLRGRLRASELRCWMLRRIVICVALQAFTFKTGVDLYHESGNVKVEVYGMEPKNGFTQLKDTYAEDGTFCSLVNLKEYPLDFDEPLFLLIFTK